MHLGVSFFHPQELPKTMSSLKIPPGLEPAQEIMKGIAAMSGGGGKKGEREEETALGRREWIAFR